MCNILKISGCDKFTLFSMMNTKVAGSIPARGRFYPERIIFVLRTALAVTVPSVSKKKTTYLKNFYIVKVGSTKQAEFLG
jgi:hypothetical protein